MFHHRPSEKTLLTLPRASRTATFSLFSQQNLNQYLSCTVPNCLGRDSDSRSCIAVHNYQNAVVRAESLTSEERPVLCRTACRCSYKPVRSPIPMTSNWPDTRDCTTTHKPADTARSGPGKNQFHWSYPDPEKGSQHVVPQLIQAVLWPGYRQAHKLADKPECIEELVVWSVQQQVP